MIKLTPLVSEVERTTRFLKPKFEKALRSGAFSSAYGKLAEGNGIYRGAKGTSSYPYWIVNPSKSYRVSANTTNFYTGLIDKLPSWKEWPKRSRSIICSTTPDGANGFGNVLIVLPKNGAKIGICRTYDFWDSFLVIRKRLKIMGMDQFNNRFSTIFFIIHKSLKNMAVNLTEETYDEFIKKLNEDLQKSEFLKAISDSYLDSSDKIPMISDVEENFNGDWEQYFDGLMNPIENGFKLQTIETYEGYTGSSKEIWTDASSLMIQKDKRDELLLSKVPQKPQPGDPNLDIDL